MPTFEEDDPYGGFSPEVCLSGPASVRRCRGHSRCKLKQVQLNKKLAKLDLELAEKFLEIRYIRSPINGTITKIASRPGEHANAGDIVVTVADTANIVTEIPLSGHILKNLLEGACIPLRVAGSNVTRLAKVHLPSGRSKKWRENSKSGLCQSGTRAAH